MGQITRTNFGLTKTRVLTNGEVLHLPTTPIEIIPVEAGVLFVPVFCFLALHWVADYGGIDVDSQIQIGIASSSASWCIWDETVGNGVTNLLKLGLSSSGFAYVVANYANGILYGSSGVNDGEFAGAIEIRAVNDAIFTGGDAGNTLTATVFYSAVARP